MSEASGKGRWFCFLERYDSGWVLGGKKFDVRPLYLQVQGDDRTFLAGKMVTTDGGTAWAVRAGTYPATGGLGRGGWEREISGWGSVEVPSGQK